MLGVPQSCDGRACIARSKELDDAMRGVRFFVQRIVSRVNHSSIALSQ